MAGLKRRILGITVISAGICAALPFRNEAVNAPADTRQPAEFPSTATSHNELTLQLTVPTTPVAAPKGFGGQQPISAVKDTKPTSQPQEFRRDELHTPPSIALAFEPLVPSKDTAAIPAATFPVATTQARPSLNRDRPARRHRIVDGDTLEALAQRYLGHRDQWLSIFDANRSLLTDPNILPIGEEILVPSVRHPSHDDANDHLVPVPPEILNREE